MTNTYRSDDTILTNNDYESYNYRMKRKIGDHPNLPTFLRHLKKENSVIELKWRQNDGQYSTKGRRKEDVEKEKNGKSGRYILF